MFKMSYPLAVLALLILSVAAQGQELTARQIMEKQKEMHEAASEQSSLVMILVDRKGGKKQRTVKSYKKTFEGGLAASLLIFTKPADLEGTCILSKETAPGKGMQWMYLPASKSLQRIAGGAKTDYFMGTDLTYEDMEADDLDSFTLTLAGSEAVDGQDCFIIEVVPATEQGRKESGYSKRVFYVRKDIFFTVKTVFFDRRGRELKTQTSHSLERVSGDMWVAKKSLIDNKRMRHKTLIGLASYEVEVDLDDEIFTERFVSSGRMPQ